MNRKNSNQIFNNLTQKGKDKRDFYRIKKKNKEAFLAVYDRYAEDIYRFVYFKVSSPEEAKDITSAVFLKAWNSLRENEIGEAKSLAAYLYKIARNCIIDHYRQQKPTSSIERETGESLPEIEDKSQNLARQTEINSDMAIVYAKLEELKGEYKEVIILKYINELSLSEIASITGKSRNNVRVIAHRALKALKGLMEEGKK